MIRKNILNILSVFWLLLLTNGVWAQEQSTMAPWANLLKTEAPFVAGEALEQGSYYLIQIDEGRKKSVFQNEDFTLIRRLNSNTFIVRFLGPELGFTSTDGFSLWSVNNDWKLSANFNVDEIEQRLETYMVKSLDTASLKFVLNDLEVDFEELRGVFFTVIATPSIIRDHLLPLDYITYIGKESQRISLDSRVLDMNLNPNKVNRVHNDFPTLDGNGMVLSIREGMFDVADMDIRQRHLASDLEGDEPTLHATEMATIAGGAGNSSLNGLGVARAVTFTGSFLTGLIPDTDVDYRGLNVSVQNHSYGTSTIENFYGAGAELYDLSANNNPQLLHVFSAGNLGTSAPEEGAYFGVDIPVANMTGNFKMSKNTLSVASVDTVGREVSFVSRGPAHDGRVKPELVTYSVAGSSNSAAMVSGISILLQQAYQNTHNEIPASALLKAVLINSAKDVLNQGPDYISGYGNVDAYRALLNLEAGRFFKGNIALGESISYELTIPESARDLKVTLVWNDPAALANANMALVNDLDLVVTDAIDNEFMPWVLNSDESGLKDLAIRGIDRLNNVEQISIANPLSGVLSIDVSAFNIPEGVQEFYLAWQWDEADVFEWSFPTASDNMPYNGETVSYFRWESTLSHAFGELEYSLDNGETWQLIDDAVELNKGLYRWDAPDVRSSAIARMRVEGQSFPTQIFTISRPERISVGFSCADSVRLQWRALPEAERYEILTFGNAFLESVSSVTDTSFTFSKSDFSTNLFAVQPVLTDGVKSVRSATFDFDFQGVGCYLVSFFAQAEAEEGVRVNVGLGTTAGIDNVVIERQTEQGGFQQIATINNQQLAQGADFFDSSPFQGLNEYRGRIQFQNGEEISTEVSSVYFLTSKPFLVFPNPVPRGQRLNVFSKVFIDNPDVIFSLYSHAGLPLFNLELNSERSSLELDRLKPGVYFYRITASGYAFKGRVIME